VPRRGGASRARRSRLSRVARRPSERFAEPVPAERETGSSVQSDDGAVIRDSLAEPVRFGEIFERHYDRVYAYLARRVGREIGSDLAAETFTRAFTLRQRFNTGESSSALPWLFGIATNLLRHHRRTEVRKLRAYARTGVDPVLDDVPDAERRVDASAASRELARALASLRRAETDVLLLVAWADLSYAEIAEALGIEVGTVRSRLSRARTHMRELLDATGQQTIESAATAGGNDG
jgi:RNA polymerase sigma factor (sigma-70 family)